MVLEFRFGSRRKSFWTFFGHLWMWWELSSLAHEASPGVWRHFQAGTGMVRHSLLHSGCDQHGQVTTWGGRAPFFTEMGTCACGVHLTSVWRRPQKSQIKSSSWATLSFSNKPNDENLPLKEKFIMTNARRIQWTYDCMWVHTGSKERFHSIR